ncbi:MAG: hypothetical protein ABRQ39_12065 [Candidatus Eremiobacterota bacterium]
MNNHYDENMAGKKHIFILVVLVFILILTGGLMLYKDQSYDKIIATQKQQIENLQTEIETMAPIKTQIELYREETQVIKEEIKNLKKKGKL